MNINDVQKKIAELDSKFKLLNVETYYDKDYNYRIRKSSYDVAIKLINNISDIKSEEIIENILKNVLYISLSDDINVNNINIINESDLDRLLQLKEKCENSIYEKISNYMLFDKNNKSFFKVYDSIDNYYKKTEIKSYYKKASKESVKKENIDVIKLLKDEFNNKYDFIKRRNYYISTDNSTAVLFMHSKRHDHISYKYWYTFHTYQKNELEKYQKSFIILYFDDIDQYTIINTDKLYPYLSKLGKTEHGDNIGWHLHIQEKDGVYSIRIPKEGLLNIDDSELEQEFNRNMENSDNNMTTIKISLKDYKVIKFK